MNLQELLAVMIIGGMAVPMAPILLWVFVVDLEPIREKLFGSPAQG